MEADDDTFIIVVGDDGEGSLVLAPNQIKEEINDVLKDSVCEKINISIEDEFQDYYKRCEDDNNNSYLDTDKFEDFCDDNLEYVPDVLEESLDKLSYSSSEENSNIIKIRKDKQRTKMLKPSERKSYVKELKSVFPELREDNKLLISCLVEIMKTTQPPNPPQDYYVMNGIMLECVFCGRQSNSIPAAGRHFQEKHGKRYLFCYACGVNFRSTTNLYKHEKRCSAPYIKLVLKARAILLGKKGRSRPFIPKIIHEVPKRFNCPLCSASFRSKYTLQSHILLHRGERPYRCNQCTAAYTSYTGLTRHKKKHNEEQYICDHCQRSFKQKQALVTHMDTHRPVKKFGCELCPKRYAQKAALVLHINRVHKNLPPPCACQICSKRYPRMSLLKDHMKNVHGMIIMTRKMFFKKLPTMSVTQVEQAKVVFKSEVEDPHYDLSNFNV